MTHAARRQIALEDVARDLRPVLVDVGASGGPPPAWNAIAAGSIYVGFDPDDRELPQQPPSRFLKTVIVKAAVTGDGAGVAPFFFTRSPHCSSTLRPDRAALADYAFAPLFDIVGEGTVRTVSLNDVLRQEALNGIDWLKLDTQGTDLRIFKSLDDKVRGRVIAVDIEPGLIDAYEGEDLFVDVHRELTREGFWLSNLNIGGAIRASRETIADIERSDARATAASVDRRSRLSPAWCEARYLRTVRFLSESGLGKREHLLLAVIAALDGQWAFAFETAVACQRAFGPDAACDRVKRACAGQLGQQPSWKARLKRLLRPSAVPESASR